MKSRLEEIMAAAKASDLRRAMHRRVQKTESPLEQRFLDLIRYHGFEEPELQYLVEVGDGEAPAWYRIDFAYPRLKLAVETDGKGPAGQPFHDPEYDRRRDQRLSNIGWKTIRFTWNSVTREEDVLRDLVEVGVTKSVGPAERYRGLAHVLALLHRRRALREREYTVDEEGTTHWFGEEDSPL